MFGPPIFLSTYSTAHTAEYSGQSLSFTTKEPHLSWSVSESAGIDSEKKPLEPIPEGDVKAGGDLASASGVKGAETDVICNPDTMDRDKSKDEECDKQEATI